MNTIFSYYASLGLKALQYEVLASPKPGLVDRFDCGAHADMDIFTFAGSISLLGEYFKTCMEEGCKSSPMDIGKILENIRPYGIIAEKRMLMETKGANTHKGIIFSFGIIYQALGRFLALNPDKPINIEDIIELIKGISLNVLKEFSQKGTYGLDNYEKFGILGIRGEVHSGFCSVINYGLPSLRNAMKTMNINNAIIQCLLSLMAKLEDSNIIGRAGIEGLKYVQHMAQKALDLGGTHSEEGKLFVKSMNEEFVKKSLSPGGSADLTAVSLLFSFIFKE